MSRFSRTTIAMCLTAGTLLTACNRDHLTPYVDPADRAVLERTFSVAELREDLDTLFAWIDATHPALEARSPDSTRRRVHAQMRARITKPMTRREFFRAAGSVTSVFRDGHAGVLPPFTEFAAHVAGGGAVFPLQLARRGESIEVLFDASDEAGIPRGATILRIDGEPIDALLNHWSTYARGESPVLREAIVLEDLATWQWHLGNNPAAPGSHVIDYVVDGVERRTRLSTVSRDSIAVRRKRGQPGSAAVAEELRVDSATAGLTWLTIPSFSGDEGQFERTVDAAITAARARRDRVLVIDVSRNPGGSTDQVSYLLARLTTRPCPMVSSVHERLNSHNQGIAGWRGSAGTIHSMNEDVTVQPAAPDMRFLGRIVALIGPPTYSAAIVFATSLRDCGIADLMGEPTGGFANQTGQIHFRELPHTRLRAFSPTRALVRPSGKEGAEVLQPDVYVPRTDERRAQLARQLLAQP